MGYNNRFRIVIFLVILFCASLIRPVYAYLDPGTGSFFLQMLLAGLLGALFFLKSFWRAIFRRIKNIFVKLRSLFKRG